jgi:SAM-dependent methyltransferase
MLFNALFDIWLKIAKRYVEWARMPKVDDHFNVVADCGCGEGIFGIFLKEHADSVVGIDLSVFKLENAHRRGDYESLLMGDISCLPLREETIDCYTMFDVIEHIPKGVIQGFLETPRCVYLTTPEEYYSNKFFAGLLSSPYEEHVSSWTKEELEELGFNVTVERPGFSRILNLGTIHAKRAHL